MSKIAVITGGSRGIGKEIVLNLAAMGIDVVFSYCNNEMAAKEVIAAVKAKGQKAVAFPFDAQDSKNAIQFINDVTTYLKAENGVPNFDILINNAGTGTFNLIDNTTENQFDDMYNVHLKSVYFMSQKAIEFLNDGGCILNISSGLTRFSFPGMSAYAMMKGAVEVMSRYLAKELAERRITVNCIAPGAIATDFAGGANKEAAKSEVIASLTALGRVGEVEDIGGVVAFLCSDNAGWINGQRLEVSGGMLL